MFDAKQLGSDIHIRSLDLFKFNTKPFNWMLLNGIPNMVLGQFYDYFHASQIMAVGAIFYVFCYGKFCASILVYKLFFLFLKTINFPFCHDENWVRRSER